VAVFLRQPQGGGKLSPVCDHRGAAYIRGMAQDPYSVLGVPKDASADDIKAAFRKLAKKHHPDLNPGNAAAEARFKAASAAHEMLSDPEQRGKFDRGEINAEGQPAERHYYRQYAEGAGGARYRPGAQPPDGEFGDIFADLFRHAQANGRETGHAPRPMRGQDQVFALTVPFTEAALGGSRRITLPEGRTLDVAIPVGLEDGQTLRLRGQGHAGWNGGPPGDVLIEVSVAPHKFFRREGQDIHLDLPVTAAEAVLGARVSAPTLTGPVTLSVPRHSDAGKKLRLRGRGIPAHAGHEAGDLYVTLALVTGQPDEALEEALRGWLDRHKDDPRAEMMEGA
jgi:DnaJ-class molecular chaperone